MEWLLEGNMKRMGAVEVFLTFSSDVGQKRI